MTGNQAIALGAAAAGCKFLAQYPITPASTVMHWMAAHSHSIGVVVKQAEDELAAIHMAIGASFAGVRSMTATSGGGFALMTEGLGIGRDDGDTGRGRGSAACGSFYRTSRRRPNKAT